MSENPSQWIIRTVDFKQNPLNLRIETCTRPMLVKKALQNLASFWAAALLCVLIPVAHFVLVPLCLILGLVFGFRALSFRYHIQSGTAECPQCHSKMEMKNLWFKDESRTRCELCGSQVVIGKIDAL